jgi:hypothetical protein
MLPALSDHFRYGRDIDTAVNRIRRLHRTWNGAANRARRPSGCAPVLPLYCPRTGREGDSPTCSQLIPSIRGNPRRVLGGEHRRRSGGFVGSQQGLAKPVRESLRGSLLAASTSAGGGSCGDWRREADALNRLQGQEGWSENASAAMASVGGQGCVSRSIVPHLQGCFRGPPGGRFRSSPTRTKRRSHPAECNDCHASTPS